MRPRALAFVPLVLALLLGAPGAAPAPGAATSASHGVAPAAAAARDTTPAADHVVLISVDGLRPEFYLEGRWPAPNLQEMAREGAHARAVTSVFPSVTYPAHTTILTGALPARHGILYNTPFRVEAPTREWYWYEDSIRVETLWDAVRRSGGTTASVGWPVSVGAPVDRNVPEIWPLEPEADPIAPLRAHDRPDDLLEEIEREATGRLTGDNFTIDHMTRDDRAGAAAAYLLERYGPRLLTLHLIETDHLQHQEGREGDGVRRAVAAADRAIGQIREAAERAGILERTAFVVTGDHGFGGIHTWLAPNVWLARAGLRDTARDRGAWRATFHTQGGSAFLRVRAPDSAQTVAAVRHALAELDPGVRGLFRVVDREELRRLRADPDAVLALAAEPGVAFTARASGPAAYPASGGTHGYDPSLPRMRTGFVAWGAGIRPGAVAPEMRLTDVAPLVARLLGIEFDAPDGVLYPGLLAPRALEEDGGS